MILLRSDIETMVEAMYTSTELDASIMNIVGTAMLIGGIILAVILAIKIGANYIVNSLKFLKNLNIGSGMDYMEIARIIFLTFLFLTYTLWMTPIAEGINLLASLASTSEESQKQLSQWKSDIWMTQKAQVKMKAASGASPGAVSYILHNPDEFSESGVVIAQYYNNNVYKSVDLKTEIPTKWGEMDDVDKRRLRNLKKDSEYLQMGALDKIAHFFSNMGDMLLSQIGWAVAKLIRAFMATLVRLMWALTVIFGPMAIAFSIAYKDIFNHWFKIFLNAGFAMITLRFIDHLAFTWINEINDLTQTSGELSNGALGSSDSGFNIMFSFLLCALYLMVYRVTSWFVGKSEMGKVAGKGVQIGAITAGAAAGMAMMKSGIGAKQGQGMMGAMQNAAKGGQKAGENSKKVFDE